MGGTYHRTVVGEDRRQQAATTSPVGGDPPGARRVERDWIRSAALVALALAIAYFAARGVLRGWLDSGDLSVGYSGGSAWLAGSDPYAVSILQERLAAAGGGERLVNQLEHLRNVYAPTTLPLFAPLAVLPWEGALLVWLLIDVGATVFIAVGLARLLGWRLRATATIAFTAALLALAPVHSTIASGQTGLAATAALVGALLAQRSGRAVWTAALYALAVALKLQIGLPFLAYLAWRRWRTAAAATAILLGATLVSVARMGLADVSWLPTWMANLTFLSGPGGINDPGPLNEDRYSLVNLQYPLHALTSGGWADVVTYLGVGLAAGLVIWLNRGREPRLDLLALSTVAVLALLVTYHRYYDAVLLAFPIAWAISSLRTRLWPQAAVVLVLSSDFLLPAQTALHDLEVRGLVPGWLVANPVWEVVLIAQHAWALVLMAVVLLWAARRDRSIDADEAASRSSSDLHGDPAGPT